MSSIPNAKMKHAHVVEEGAAPPPKPDKKAKASESLAGRARELGERAQDLAEDAVDAVKARPKTAAAIGAGLVAGAAALVGAATGVFRSEDKPAAVKKAPAKKPAKKKG